MQQKVLKRAAENAAKHCFAKTKKIMTKIIINLTIISLVIYTHILIIKKRLRNAKDTD